MNAKKLFVLIAVAVVALIGAYLVSTSNRPESDVAAQDTTLLPQLHAQLNDVNTITLTGAGDKVLVTLKRGKDGWSVAQKSGYPADVTKIREFLLKLDQAKTIESKTANPKLYAKLGVDDVKDKNAKGVLVQMQGSGKPIRLIVGNYNGSGGGGTFVRRDGEAQSWLVNGNLTVAKNVSDWEKRDLADIPSSRLHTITLTAPDGKSLKVYKEQASDTNFKVADVPKRREVSSEYVANELGSVLSGLRADDVFTAADKPAPDKAWKDRYETFDGLVVDATGWDANDKKYAQFTASVDDKAANAHIDAEQAKAKADYESALARAKAEAADKSADKSSTRSDGKAVAAKPKAAAAPPKPAAVSDPAKDRKDRLDALAKEAAKLNATFSGWTFALPSYKFTDMSKSMDELLKPLPSKKTAAHAKHAHRSAKKHK